MTGRLNYTAFCFVIPIDRIGRSGGCPGRERRLSSTETTPGSLPLWRRQDTSAIRIIRKTPCIILRMTTIRRGISFKSKYGNTWKLRDYPDQWIVTYPSTYERLYPKSSIVFQHPVLTPERYVQIRKGLQTFRLEAPGKAGTIRLPKIEIATGKKHK